MSEGETRIQWRLALQARMGNRIEREFELRMEIRVRYKSCVRLGRVNGTAALHSRSLDSWLPIPGARSAIGTGGRMRTERGNRARRIEPAGQRGARDSLALAFSLGGLRFSFGRLMGASERDSESSGSLT